MLTVLGTNTHRGACKGCAAPVALRAGTPTGTVAPANRLDAVAVVTRGRQADGLPVLADPTVRWECPACDTVN